MTVAANKTSKKIYGIFCKKDDPAYLGYVENSFSMSWTPDYVRVWRRIVDAKNNLKIILSYRKNTDNKYFIARLNSKKSPVNITWKRFADKFNSRNAKFTIKNQ